MLSILSRGFLKGKTIPNKTLYSCLAASELAGGYLLYRAQCEKKKREGMDRWYNSKIHWMEQDKQMSENRLRNEIWALRRELHEEQKRRKKEMEDLKKLEEVE